MLAAIKEVRLEGTAFQLLGRRGVYWPAQQMLMVADPHFGKEATFRFHRIPVPRGSTTATLSRVAHMIQQTAAVRVVILGDMVHARSSLSPDVCGELDRFFALHDDVEFTLTCGNHDVPVRNLLEPWPIEVVSEMWVDDILLAHHPLEVPTPARLMLCGHLHPSIRLENQSDRLGTLPCFWWSRQRLVLPAVGKFTGTHRVSPRPGDRVWGIAEDAVFEHRVG